MNYVSNITELGKVACSDLYWGIFAAATLWIIGSTAAQLLSRLCSWCFGQWVFWILWYAVMGICLMGFGYLGASQIHFWHFINLLLEGCDTPMFRWGTLCFSIFAGLIPLYRTMVSAKALFDNGLGDNFWGFGWEVRIVLTVGWLLLLARWLVMQELKYWVCTGLKG